MVPKPGLSRDLVRGQHLAPPARRDLEHLPRGSLAEAPRGPGSAVGTQPNDFNAHASHVELRVIDRALPVAGSGREVYPELLVAPCRVANEAQKPYAEISYLA